MPWTDDSPPDVAKNWPAEAQKKCVMAANAVLADGGSDDEAIYACISAAGRSEQARAVFAAEHALDMEIFAPGTWSGSAGPLSFTDEDMGKIVAAFDALKERHRVPLKLGHSGDADVREGQPAIGWVEKVWVEGGKLMAKTAVVSDTVWNAIKKKLYRNVSIELDFDVKHKGSLYEMVLSGVALLGAELPAVNNLADLQTYMGKRLHGARCAAFTVGEKDKGPEPRSTKAMSDDGNKEIMARLETLSKQVLELNTKVVEFQQENAQLKIENRDLKAAAEVRDTEDKKETVVAHRRKVVDALDSLVKSKVILPAQRESFKKQTGVDDDEKVLLIDPAGIPALFGANATAVKRSAQKRAEKVGKEFARGSGSSDANEEDSSDDGLEAHEIVHRKATRLAGERKIAYSQAVTAVLDEEPDLAKAWFTREPVSVGEED